MSTNRRGLGRWLPFLGGRSQPNNRIHAGPHFEESVEPTEPRIRRVEPGDAREQEVAAAKALVAGDHAQAARLFRASAAAWSKAGEPKRAVVNLQAAVMLAMEADPTGTLPELRRWLDLRNALPPADRVLPMDDEMCEGLARFCSTLAAHAGAIDPLAGPGLMAGLGEAGVAEHARVISDARAWIDVSLQVVDRREGLPLALLRSQRAFLDIASDPEGAVRDAGEAKAYFRDAGDELMWLGCVQTMSQAHMRRGALAAALAVTEEALAELSPKADPMHRLHLLAERGKFLSRIGPIEKAVPAVEDAIALSREMPGQEALYMRGSLSTALANLFSQQGQIERAIPTEIEALEIAHAFGALHPQAGCLQSLGASCGMISQRWGRDMSREAVDDLLTRIREAVTRCGLLSDAPTDADALSQALLSRAAEIFSDLGDHVSAGKALGNLSNFSSSQDAPATIALLTRVIRDVRASGGSADDEMVPLANLAAAYAESGRLSAAKVCYDRALEIAAATGNLAWAADSATSLGRLCLSADDTARATRYLERAVGLIDLRRQTLPASEEARIAFARGAPAPHGPLIELYLAAARPADAFDVVQRAKSRALLEMSWIRDADDASASALLTPLASAEELQLAQSLRQAGSGSGPEALRSSFRQVESELARLGDGAVLIDFYLQDSCLQVFVVRSGDKAPTCRTLAVTEDQVRGWREELERQVVRYRGQGPQTWQNAGEALLAPLQDLIRRGDTLVVAPHRGLHGIPIHALPLRGAPLITRHAVCYLPSASMLPVHRAAAGPGPKRGLKCCAIGIDFQAEAERVAALFPVHTLLQEPVGVETLRRACPGHDVYHFSCHGHFDPIEPMRSGLVLSPGATGSVEDGLLTLEKVMSMDFGSQLVSLSACESGASRVLQGDEQIGLVRAFLLSGAPSVVSTLWPVAAESAERFFLAFYAAFLADEGAAPFRKARAVQAAVQQLRKSTRTQSPFDWAPFVLSGYPA